MTISPCRSVLVLMPEGTPPYINAAVAAVGFLVLPIPNLITYKSLIK